MKRLLILIALLPSLLQAQNPDTAQMLVDRYVAMLNYGALPSDSLLVMETTISFVGSEDTFIMRRWYAPLDMMRVEVWRGDSLTAGYCTNGSSRYREYSAYNGWWNDLDSANYARMAELYDFRGPFYGKRASDTRFSYAGTTTLKGQPLAAVLAEHKNLYQRYYLFEMQSGLLLFIIDTDKLTDGTGRHYAHSDWKAYHEYLPVGPCLIPSEESYLRDGLLTVMHTTAHFEARNDRIFNQDNR